jgi:hypothetical protein
MPNDLYEDDILRWSEQQAALLRRLARGEHVNDQVDWDNLVEEIESVGNEQRHAAESLLVNIMRHRLQIMAWPEASAAAHWQHEIGVWQVQLERRLRGSPKLRAEVEATLQDLYGDAVRTAYREIDGIPRPPAPHACPWTLAQLLAESTAP